MLIAVALPLGYLFGEEEYERLTRIQQISNAPGFAPAFFEEVIRSDSKRDTSFRVRYRYVVNGQQYRVTTTSTDRQGALEYVADQGAQVAYSTRDPSIGIFKRYYDLRDPQDTLTRSLIVTSVLALVLSLPIALGISWRLGWLRRSRMR